MKRKSFKFLWLILIFHLNAFAQNGSELVNIKTLDSTIVVEIKYASADNFMKEVLYTADICLLRRTVAEKLVKVHQFLQKGGLGLKVWDGYRPLSIQRKMWEKIPDPGYVADPKFGSNHNRAAAVDVTLVDFMGNELEMPTKFDDFTKKARYNYPHVSETALENRKILQNAMRSQDFQIIKSEWWHFNDCDAKKYSILDIPLENFVKKEK